jgi:hypothetical protein
MANITGQKKKKRLLELGSSVILMGFIPQDEDFGIHSKNHRKPLKDLK